MINLRQVLILIGFFLVTIGFGGSPTAALAQPETLTIAAANSLKDALRKVLPLFEARYPERRIRIVYGPSQTLRSQIEQGAPIDVFLPSIVEEIEQLQQKNLIVPGTTRIYAGTSLVLITGSAVPAPIAKVEDLRAGPVRRIAVGNPRTSSVGKIAAQFLTRTALEPVLASRYVFGEHSRAVLDLVANGEADVGLVYRTDAAFNKRVIILDTVAEDSHAPIHYGVALPWTAVNISGAGDFIDFLLTPPTQTILQAHGFDHVSTTTARPQTEESPR